MLNLGSENGIFNDGWKIFLTGVIILLNYKELVIS